MRRTARLCRHLTVQGLALFLSLTVPLTSMAADFKTEGPAHIIEGAPFQISGEKIDLSLNMTGISSDESLQPADPIELENISDSVKEQYQWVHALPRQIAPEQITAKVAQQTLSTIPAMKQATQRLSMASARIGEMIGRIGRSLPWLSAPSDPNPGMGNNNSPKEESPLLRNTASFINQNESVPFIPVSKKVNQLKELAQKDPSAAWAKAREIINDPLEKSVVVKSSALDILETAPISEFFPVTIKLLEMRDQKQWYLMREAARILGAHAADLSVEQRAKALKSLQAIPNAQATIDSLISETNLSEAQTKDLKEKMIPALRPVASVFNMAQWALGQMGAAPSPYQNAGIRVIIQGPQSSPSPTSYKLPWYRRIPQNAWLMGLAAIGIGLSIYSLLQLDPNAPVSTPKQPTPIVQIQKPAPAPQTPPALTEKPAAPSQLDQIAKDTASMAKSLEQLAKPAPKPQSSFWDDISGYIPMVLLLGALLFLPRLLGRGASPIPKMSNQKTEKPLTRFSDVGGVDESLTEVQEIADYLRNPQKWARAGATPPKGVLLVGPPGTGKTLLAKALAGEANASFKSMTGSDFVEMFVGLGASRVRQLFDEARKNKPMIIFIDEIDAIGKARGSNSAMGGNDEREQTLNQLLTAMDGFDGSDGIIIMAATNREDVLDPALLRPGRFDRKIYVGNPDALGRKAVLAIHAEKASLHHDVKLDSVVRRTTGFSGAELMGVVEEAKRLATRRNDASISPKDINDAIDKMTAGTERHLALSPEVKRRVAYHESGHILAGFLSGQPLANKVTIIPHGGQALGYAEPAPENEDDVFILTKTELKRRLVGMMGGRAAEEIMFGETSTGPGSDIEQAERLARNMVEKLGMDADVGILTSGTDGMGVRRVSEKTANRMDLAVKKLIGEALTNATVLLQKNRATLDDLAQNLIERETLDREDMEKIVTRSSK